MANKNNTSDPFNNTYGENATLNGVSIIIDGRNPLAPYDTDGGSETPMEDMISQLTVKVDKNDKILSKSDENMISIVLGLDVDGDKIKLTGKNNETISEISLVDRFLKSVDYDSTTKELIFLFETESGEQEVRVYIGTLVDDYTAGNGLELNEKEFSVKIDSDENNIITSSENGLMAVAKDWQPEIDSAVQVERERAINIEANINAELVNTNTALNQVAVGLDTVNTELTNTNDVMIQIWQGSVNRDKALDNKINFINTKLETLGKTNIEVIDYNGETDINEPTKDLIITGNVPITGTTKITGKTIVIKDINISDGHLKLTATGDVDIKDCVINGTASKSGGNAAVSINTNGFVSLSNITWDKNCYNPFEIGLASGSLPQGILIENIDFNTEVGNNNISIFGTTNNAVVTISNCHFVKAANGVRISNKENVKATYNFINCTYDTTADGEYAGFVIMEDYTSGEAEETNNLFAPEKLTFNFSNLIGPGGNKINPENVADVCYGNGDTTKQVIYVYYDRKGMIEYGDGSKYPTINFN